MTAARNAIVEEIEAALADMLDTYATLRGKYIRGDADDFHSLNGPDRDIAMEVATYRNAARLVREHRDEDAGIGLPSYVYDEWADAERAVSERLAAATLSSELSVEPPLGYLVVAKRGEHNTSTGPVWSRRDRAVSHQQRLSKDRHDHPSYWHGAEFVLTAVREETP